MGIHLIYVIFWLGIILAAAAVIQTVISSFFTVKGVTSLNRYRNRGVVCDGRDPEILYHSDGSLSLQMTYEYRGTTITGTLAPCCHIGNDAVKRIAASGKELRVTVDPDYPRMFCATYAIDSGMKDNALVGVGRAVHTAVFVFYLFFAIRAFAALLLFFHFINWLCSL